MIHNKAMDEHAGEVGRSRVFPLSIAPISLFGREKAEGMLKKRICFYIGMFSATF